MLKRKHKELETKEIIENKKILLRLKMLNKTNTVSIAGFFAVLIIASVISLIIPLRPTYSESEKRELKKFPKFSLSALCSGDYFSDIDTWFSDTFPARDFFARLNAGLKFNFSPSSVVIHGELEKGDEIPEIEISEEETTEENITQTPETENEVFESDIKEEELTQTLGALLIDKDTAYEYYNFSQSVAGSYSATINKASALLGENIKIYDIIVPTSMGITARESLVSKIDTSDQKAAIDYIYSNIYSPVSCVNVFDALKAHKNEYIYFRTDHHWTAKGAYYAYFELMNAKGETPRDLTEFTELSFPGFLGSFYTQSKLPALEGNPDTVYAYVPPSTNDMSILNIYGNWIAQKIVSDVSASGPNAKYYTFIRGDHPLSVINNPNVQNGKNCVVIKESFGNAFVPFLTEHYQNIYVVDYRHFPKVDSRGLLQLCTDTNSTEVIFITNISATRNKTLVNSINSFVR